ncbi:hypothetical protein VNO77_27550 [Canavalia gladiata]|uniref:PGG domain-containing protein n=1 Tax=Canavalia gladiata TaxID=3824 RepID=A0AAN9KY20_CANGL
MEGSKRQETFEGDAEVNIDIPAEEINNDPSLNEVQDFSSINETMVCEKQPSELNDRGEENRDDENLENKVPSEGISEPEASSELLEDNISKLESPLFQTFFRLAESYGNNKCVNEICQFLSDVNGTAEAEIEDTKRGLSKSIESHSDNKNWKLLRDACFSTKLPNDVSSNYWEKLRENENFDLESPLGNTVLHLAARNGNEDFVQKIALEASHLLTAKNFNDDTALHVAAKAGHFITLEKLVAAHRSNSKSLEEASEKILEKNKQGNTFFHEALIYGYKEVMNFLLSLENFEEVTKGALLLQINNENKSGLYLAIEGGFNEVINEAFIRVVPKDPNYVPEGKSPLLAAIVKQDIASIGYLKGVQHLLRKCASCAMERDKYGYFPIHLASYAGHVKVVEELIKEEYCTHPRELLTKDGRNILHLAAQSGKYKVVRHILKSTHHDFQKMINDQDAKGNTALHLATLCCHPKVVQALIWDKRVKHSLVNNKDQTALEACMPPDNPTLRQWLTWLALKSAGVQSGEPESSPLRVPPESTYKFLKQKAPKMDQYKDRINTLVLVSTLIVTVTFAAGFTMPGGSNGSDPGKGMATMLKHIWFKLYIFCLTISLYGAISVTIILIWAQLGDITLAFLALTVARPILGVILATLSIAFLAGVHLVITELSWLATSTLIMALVFIFMLLLFYTLLWFPSSSSNIVVRYLSYYPFLLLASFAS